MFIDLGSEAPPVSEDEIGEIAATLFSSKDVFSIQDSDGENVEFIISSGDSSDDDNVQELLNKSSPSVDRNSVFPTVIPCAVRESVEDKNLSEIVYDCEVDSTRVECDAVRDITSQPPCSTDGNAPELPKRKYSSVKSLGDVLEDSMNTRRHLCQFKSVLKMPRLMYAMTLLAYVCFMCLGSFIFKYTETPDFGKLESIDKIIGSLYNCQCFSGK